MANIQEIIAREAAAAAQQQITSVLSGIIDSVKRGDFSGFQLPGRQSPTEVKQDAKERSVRTFVQQFGIDLAVAIATIVGPLLLSLDVSSKEQWTIIGLSIVKTVVSTLISYIARLAWAPKAETEISLADAKQLGNTTY